MRLTSLLIVNSFIICNVLIVALAKGNETASETTADGGGEADSEDKHPLKFINQTDKPQPPPPPLINALSNIVTTAPTITTTPYLITSWTYAKVCSGVHIRNDLKSFEQLRGCNIIDGPLTIALISNQTHPYEPKDYENITFPDLHEITEYLLFFRVQGLSTLSTLFPNLTVIRGKELVSNYALIIYEMMHLQKINLPRLADILHGSVRIESNPNLCYVSTVNWEGICKHVFTPHFIKDNNARCSNSCPEHCLPWITKSISDSNRLQGDVNELGAENNRSLFCWNGQNCHEMYQTADGIGLAFGSDGVPCHLQCAGGCFIGNRSDSCYSCRSVSQQDKCVDHCAHGLYEYKGRCINEQACILMVELSVQPSSCSKETKPQTTTTNLKAVIIPGEKHGRCQVSCPPGYEEDPTNKNKCKSCDRGKCRKVCTSPHEASDKPPPFMVTNINSLRELSGCNVINGSLEISMKGGKNVLHELETVFQELEEIKGYLKITRSYPILTLGFLSRLKAINGSELDRGQYSLIIIDNLNLQELFMFKKSENNQKQLKILEGKIFVHLNPKLCPHRINDLKTYTSVADWDERDVSLHTNGDKEACNTQKLEVQFLHGTSRAAMIRFQNFANFMEDPRSLLYYLINYREAPNGTVTMFDGRDGCNSQNDKWNILEEAPVIKSKDMDKYHETFIKVKPATRYALYIKTFTILAGSTGALSDIIYFETAPDTPGIPRQIESEARDSSSVTVGWSPPTKSNGVIERYTLTITRIPELEDFQNLDICSSSNVISNRDKITQSLTKDEPTHNALLPSQQQSQPTASNAANSSENVSGSITTCLKATSDADADIQAEVVTFQDMIIDIVYLKQPCANKSARKRKRSIDYNYDSSSMEASRTLEFKNAPKTETNIDNVTIKPNTVLPLVKNNHLTQPHIRFDHIIGKTEHNITVNHSIPDGRMIAVIENLAHFSLYTIEIVACHGEYTGKNTVPSKTYSKCSLQAITQVRTQAIPSYDKIDPNSILLNLANETSSYHFITWDRPERPNGLILAFRVRYRPKNGPQDLWTEGCVNITTYTRDGGFILSNIAPGSYLFGVQTISMYSGSKFWIEYEFEIPQNYLVSPAVLTLLIIMGLILLAFVVASGTYYYQKRRHELANGLIYASVNPDYIQYDPDEWEVDKSNLIIGARIGTGSFGEVYKGQLNTEKGALNCAIKTVPTTSTAKQRMDFLREASIMKQFDTYHVVKLMGVVSTTTPVYVVMEYMENGDLKTFLREQREVHLKEKKLLVDGIYLMAAQIADGMAYLASKKFVHRDLAARNCMVGENRIVKIGDFGLTRDIFANDYYRRDTQGRLPVRWMAPESLKDNLYTSASDVWSYGIVVWEIVTFSAYPYQGQSNDEVIKRVISGFTMSRPENCTDKLYHIMEKCWKKDSRDRPTFNDIVEYLLPETESKMYPNCFYRKVKPESDSIANPSTITEANNVGPESYPLLPWPMNRANGVASGHG